MLVLDQIEALDPAVARACRDDRDFALEGHERFENCRLFADLPPSRGRVGLVAHLDLALAVVAEAPRLEDRRRAGRAERGSKLRWRADFGKSRGGDAEAGDEVFLGQSILGDRQHLRVRQHRRARGQEGRGLRRHILELVGDHIDIGGEAVERGVIGIVGAGDPMHHIEGGRVRTGSEDMAFESEARGREREHAAELAAAENADRRVGGEHVKPGVPIPKLADPCCTL